MSREKQIEEQEAIREIAEILTNSPSCLGLPCSECEYRGEPNCMECFKARQIYNADYRKQSEGWWEWYEEWSSSTTEHPRECDECGWRCHECETPLADAVGGYWDNPEEVPNLKFCPECGAKMKGGAE